VAKRHTMTRRLMRIELTIPHEEFEPDSSAASALRISYPCAAGAVMHMVKH
jgi:hypothetical protein